MYSSEKNPGINWKDIIVKVIFFVIFILLLMWIFPKTPNMTPFYSNVFRENISYMQDAAKSYYTDERLPKEVGDVAYITLQDMINKNLIIPFVDKDGNSCDLQNSYVQVTKEENEFSLKVNLECGEEKSYIIETMGCYTYCESGDCQTVAALEYQYKQSYTTNKTTYSCPSGYTLSGTKCYKTTNTSVVDATKNYKTTDVTEDAKYNGKDGYYSYTDYNVSLDTTYSCPSGYTKSGSTCYKKVAATASTTSTSSCPSGYTKSGTTCYIKISATATSAGTTYSCPSGYTKSGTSCTKTTSATYSTSRQYLSGTFTYAPSGYKCSTSSQYVCTSSSNCPGYVTVYSSCYKDAGSYSCPSGYTLSGSTCKYTISATATSSGTTYSCPSGYTKSGTSCYKYTSMDTDSNTTYSCPSGYTKSGTSCYKYTDMDTDYDYVYSCPSGYTKSGSGSSTKCYKYVSSTKTYYCENSSLTLSGTKCVGTTKTFTGYSCPSGYTLSGDQCIKKSTESKNATATTKKVTGYNYKWSTETSLSGWEKTGESREVTV